MTAHAFPPTYTAIAAAPTSGEAAPAPVAPIPADALVVITQIARDTEWRWVEAQGEAAEIWTLDRLAALTGEGGLTVADTAAWALAAPIIRARLLHGQRTIVAAMATHLIPAQRDALATLAAACGRPAVWLTFGAVEATTAPWWGQAAITPHTRLDWAACAPYPTADDWIVIGDVHGHRHALERLIEAAGGVWTRAEDGECVALQLPTGRRLAFVGDLVSRGPDSLGVLTLVRRLVDAGQAECVTSNHDQALGARLVRPHRGIPDPVEWQMLTQYPPAACKGWGRWLQDRPAYRVLRSPQTPAELVVAHAGLEPGLVGRADAWLAFRCAHGVIAAGMVPYGDDDPTRCFPWQAAYTTTQARWGVHGHWGIPAARPGDGAGGEGTRSAAPIARIDASVVGPAPIGGVGLPPRVRGQCVNLDTVGAGWLTAWCWPSGAVWQVPAQR